MLMTVLWMPNEYKTLWWGYHRHEHYVFISRETWIFTLSSLTGTVTISIKKKRTSAGSCMLQPHTWVHTPHSVQTLLHIFSLFLTVTGDVARRYKCQSGFRGFRRRAVGLRAGQEAGDRAWHGTLWQAIHTPIRSELHHPVSQRTWERDRRLIRWILTSVIMVWPSGCSKF